MSKDLALVGAFLPFFLNSDWGKDWFGSKLRFCFNKLHDVSKCNCLSVILINFKGMVAPLNT